MNTYYASCAPVARALATASTLSVLVLLAACSGGDYTIETNVKPPVPPSPPVTTAEPISSFGAITEQASVAINGVRYNTSAATVTMNGEPAFPADLKLGHTIALRGTLDSDGKSGSASHIEYQAAVLGPVDAVDLSRQRAIVLGQTVLTNADTTYDPRIATGDLDGVAIGSRMQISGLLNADGQIVATRVEPVPATAALQVSGRVSDLDLGNRLFTLDRLTVDYGSLLMLDLPGGMPAEGEPLIARGSMANGVFVAQSITGLPDPGFSTADRRAQASGWITRFDAAADFEVDGHRVYASPATVFVNGTSADLDTNVMVTIDGRVSSDGQRIRAQRVTFGSVAAPGVSVPYALADFDEIVITGSFDADITRGFQFAVEIAADQALVDKLNVTRNGSVLAIGVQPAPQYQIDILEASIRLPVLNRMTISGLGFADLSNFTQTDLLLYVGELSFLRGHALAIGSLTTTVSGSSFLDLDDVEPIQHATIDVNGASFATLNMSAGSTLSGSVTGASRVQYFGTNVTVNVTTDSTSSVVRMGETRL